MNQQRHKGVVVRAELGVIIMVAVVVGLVLDSATGAFNRRAFLVGGKLADKALRFDPFTLRIRPPRGVGRRGPSAAVGRTGTPGMSPTLSTGASDEPEPRIPSRPTFRSPMRPGW